MEERPQAAIGEACIVALIVGLAQIDGGESDVAFGDKRRLHLSGFLALARPAEPQYFALERLLEHHRKAACLRLALAGSRHAIGDNYDTSHSPSSQLRLSLRAQWMMPTME